MARVVWPDEVIDRLDDLAEYIARDNPAAAEAIVARLITLGESLADFPNRGRLAPKGTREMKTVWPCILRYRIDGDVVTIVRIRHGARRPLD